MSSLPAFPAVLLPFFVVVPLAASALSVLLARHTRPLGVLQVGVPLLSAAAAAVLLAGRGDVPVLVHHVGAFVPGVAIPLVADTTTAVLLVVTGLTTAICAAYAIRIGETRLRYVPAMALLLTAGVNGALLTGDLFNLFVFIEVMLLPSYALLAMTGTWRRLGIGRMYVVVNLVTSSILLIGIGLVYGVAGTVNLAALVGGATRDPRLALAGGVVLLALLVKAGIVPLHGWLPRAYPATAAAVMGLFSALHTKVAMMAIYRLVTTLYAGDDLVRTVLLWLAVVTILVGAFGSLGERVLRRTLAYQMVTGLGFVLLALAVGSPLALAAGLFYLVHHILVMGSLLLGAGAVEATYGTGRYSRLSGLLRREPVLAVVTALGLLSLVGLPPSSGFVGKAALLRSLGELSVRSPGVLALLAAVVVVGSLASLAAVQRLWSEVFWGPPLEDLHKDPRHTGPVVPANRRIARPLLRPGLVLLVLSLVVFVGAGPVFDVCVQAAHSLLDPARYAAEVLP